MIKDPMDLIKNCLTGGNTSDGEVDDTEGPNICLRVGARFTLAKSYDLNLDSVRILAQHNAESGEEEFGDGFFEQYCIFKFDKGYAIAYHTAWWDMTFSGTTNGIDIHEGDDFKMFTDFVLTNEIRDRLRNSVDQMDADLGEMVLLNSECDEV